MTMTTTATQHAQSPYTSLTLQSLIDARHDINRLHHSTRVSHSSFPGQRSGNRRGQGLEFIDLRQYNEADDIRHIDWNVTARSNEPYTRLYREEREQVTTVVVDLRSVMFNGSDRLRSVSAAQLAARVLWQACESGDRCATIVISDSGIRSSRPMAGNKGVLTSLELVHGEFSKTSQHIQSTRSVENQPALLADSLQLISERSRSSGNCIFVSGFDTHTEKAWRSNLPSAAASGRLKAILLLDPLEYKPLASGRYHYRSENRVSTAVISSINHRDYEDYLERDINDRKKQFTDNNIPLVTVSTTISPVEFLAMLQHRGWL